MDIKSLKNKILQLAIQGKLVQQNENDEPASVLLEKIRAEKEQLIKDKVIKKEKPLPEITEEEKTFELPKGWEWCRLGEIINISSGKNLTKKSMCEDGTIPVYGGNGITGYHNDYNVSEKTIVIGRVGFYCGSVHLTEEKAWVTDNAFITKYSKNNINRKFLIMILNVTNLKGEESSTAQPVISGKKIYPMVIPLPPLEEQKRIVAKVDELFSLIDELDSNKQDLLDNISKSRNKILQLAIQGKLVEQCEEDEPASVLLEKIKEEKEHLIKDKVIKKEKPLPEISEEEKEFYLPKGWEWCRFSRATICRDGERIPVSSKEREDRPKIYDYYGASGVIDKIDNYLFNKPLLLIGEDGANLISRSTPIAFIAEGKYWVNNHAHVIDSLEYITLRYLEIYINAIDLKPFVTGTAQPKLNQANLNKIPIILPPLKEQKRIVAKVDLIMDYLDKLQQEIESQEIILEDMLQ